MARGVTGRTKKNVADTIWQLWARMEKIEAKNLREALLIAGARAALHTCMLVVSGEAKRDSLDDDELMRSMIESIVNNGKVAVEDWEGRA